MLGALAFPRIGAFDLPFFQKLRSSDGPVTPVDVEDSVCEFIERVENERVVVALLGAELVSEGSIRATWVESSTLYEEVLSNCTQGSDPSLSSP